MPLKAASLALALVLALVSFVLSTESTEEKVENVSYSDLFTVTAEYPHNTSSFTQGLFFYNGKLYESTGRYGESKVYKDVDIKSGIAPESYSFDDKIFAEGSVVFDGKLYVLTYKENIVFVMNPDTLEVEKSIPYSRQGWGLTTDGEFLIASDGSDKLFFMDGDLRNIASVSVTIGGEPLRNINELEYVDGKILANIWLTDSIAVINPESGKVISMLDFSGIYDNQSTDVNDVLNGIAYNGENGKLYITGKRWSTLFELE